MAARNPYAALQHVQKIFRVMPDCVEKLFFRRCSILGSPTDIAFKNWLGDQPIYRLGSVRDPQQD
jgi:hypothetical protein